MAIIDFNKDPIGFLRSDEALFYKNFPEAWPGTNNFLEFYAYALKFTTKVLDSNISEINCSYYFNKLSHIYQYALGYELGLYTLLLLEDSPSHPLHTGELSLIETITICLTNIQKSGWRKISSKNKKLIRKNILEAIEFSLSSPCELYIGRILRICRIGLYYRFLSSEELLDYESRLREERDPSSFSFVSKSKNKQTFYSHYIHTSSIYVKNICYYSRVVEPAVRKLLRDKVV